MRCVSQGEENLGLCPTTTEQGSCSGSAPIAGPVGRRVSAPLHLGHPRPTQGAQGSSS